LLCSPHQERDLIVGFQRLQDHSSSLPPALSFFTSPYLLMFASARGIWGNHSDVMGDQPAQDFIQGGD
jgi:hypothetical protein